MIRQLAAVLLVIFAVEKAVVAETIPENGTPTAPTEAAAPDTTSLRPENENTVRCHLHGLPPGNHRLTLHLDNHHYTTLRFSTNGDSSCTITFSPEPVLPRTRLTRRLWAGAGGIAALSCGLGIWYNHRADEAFRHYRTADASNRNTYQKTWNEFSIYRRNRNLLYTFSGLVAAAMIITIPIGSAQ